MVYIVRIGKHIKIGFSRKLEKRLKAFETSSVDIELLLSIPGGRELESRLHELLDEVKISREIFHQDWRISSFVHYVEQHGLERALQFLKETTPAARSKKKVDDFARRVAEKQKTKAEKDAYFASLVAQRKERLGW